MDRMQSVVVVDRRLEVPSHVGVPFDVVVDMRCCKSPDRLRRVVVDSVADCVRTSNLRAIRHSPGPSPKSEVVDCDVPLRVWVRV